MRKIILPTLAILMGVLCFSSCKKESVDLSGIEQGNNYLPFEIGKYIIYNVDSTIWNDFLGAEIHHSSQMRYDVVDTFTSGGALSYVINVLYRPTTLSAWEPNDVVYATVTQDRVVFTQQNLKFIKMVFPTEEGKAWNGNAMIPLNNGINAEFDNNKWLYTYADVDEQFNTGNILFEHTITVNGIDDELNDPEENPTAYAYKNYAQEKYAYNVGLIYKERIYWVFQPKSPDGQSGGSGFRKGYGVVMKAVEHN